MTRRPVPCDGCTSCCRSELVILHPEDGDNIASYDTIMVQHPMHGTPAYALKHKPNGDCVYLGDSGCTIYARAPIVCKRFDCRRLWTLLTSKQRREQMKDPIARERLLAGKKRLHTL